MAENLIDVNGISPRWLDRDVFSCAQAAAAKNFPLENELKTLVLRTTGGVCAVHIRGDRRLSLRAVKRFLNVREARLLPLPEMISIGLTPGTVCPFTEPVLNMPQLLSNAVLDLKLTTTNNGKPNGYVVFDPHLLLKVPNIRKGDFEMAPPKGDFTDEI